MEINCVSYTNSVQNLMRQTFLPCIPVCSLWSQRGSLTSLPAPTGSQRKMVLCYCGRKSVPSSKFSHTLHVWNKSFNFCVSQLPKPKEKKKKPKNCIKPFFLTFMCPIYLYLGALWGKQFLPKCLCTPPITTKNTVKVMNSFSYNAIPKQINGQ